MAMKSRSKKRTPNIVNLTVKRRYLTERDLQWQQIELCEGRLHVHRVKSGIPSVHPIRGDEMRALRKLRRDYPKDAYVFVSERGGPIGPIGFHRLIQRLGEAA